MLTQSLRTLSTLNPGSTAWMWLSEDAATPLVVIDATQDPKGQQLALRLVGAKITAVPPVFGLLNRALDGRFALTVLNGVDDGVERLARWIEANRDEHPEVSPLIGTMTLDVDGGLHTHDAVWAALSRPSTVQAASQIAALVEGQQMWCWLAEEHTDCPILLGEMPMDLQGTLFVRRVQQAEAAIGVSGVRGMLRVDEQGKIIIHASKARGQHLIALAEWAQTNVDTYPALNRLDNAQLIRMDRNGAAVKAYIRDSLWAHLRAAPTLGSLEANIANWRAAQEGAQVWFWAGWSQQTQPLVMLSLVETDPDGAVFQRAVLERMGRISGEPRMVSGMLRPMPDGSGVGLMTTDDPRELPLALGVYTLPHRALWGLARCRILHLQGDRVGHDPRADDPDKSAIDALSPKQPTYIALLRDERGAMQLMAGSAPDALKARLASVPHRSMLRGVIRMNRQGVLTLQAKNKADRLYNNLIAHITTRTQYQPWLSKLQAVQRPTL